MIVIHGDYKPDDSFEPEGVPSDWLEMLEADIAAGRRAADETPGLAARIAWNDTDVRAAEVQLALFCALERIATDPRDPATPEEVATELACILHTPERQLRVRAALEQRSVEARDIAPQVCDALQAAATTDPPEPAEDVLWIGAVVGRFFEHGRMLAEC